MNDYGVELEMLGVQEEKAEKITIVSTTKIGSFELGQRTKRKSTVLYKEECKNICFKKS